MSRTLLFAIVVAGVLAGAVAAHYYYFRLDDARPALEHGVLFGDPRPLPDFSLVDQAGKRFDNGRLRGRWTFLFFGFVNCPDICPTTLATLAALRRSLADLPAGEQPGVVFVSVDPERDTPELLGRYVAHFDPGFVGATGRAEDVESLTRRLGVAVLIGAPARDGSYSVDHSAAIFLVDPGARAAALFGTPHEAGAMSRDYRRILAARGTEGSP